MNIFILKPSTPIFLSQFVLAIISILVTYLFTQILISLINRFKRKF